MERKIIHVDMDYFFAQVEERDNPKLRGKPVAIGGLMNGRGVLSTSNYVARKYGVKAAMPTLMALKLCPQLILVPGNFEKYRKASTEIFEIFQQFTKKIERLSLDEAYLDVTDNTKYKHAKDIAIEIRRRIYGKTGLTASTGVSYNKLLAKIGSDLYKPNGMAIIPPHNIKEKIINFPIKWIWGAGKVTQEKMNLKGIYTFGDLQQFSKLDLINHFGDFGASLYNYCRGLDHRAVSEGGERKSLSVERTFSEDIKDDKIVLGYLEGAYDEMIERLKKYQERKVKTILVKIKYHDFRSTTIEASLDKVFENFKNLYFKRRGSGGDAIRLIGCGVKFYDTQTKGQLEFYL